MTVRFVLLCQVAVLFGVATRTSAQVPPDCNRYSAAGLPCPPTNGGSRPSTASARPVMAQAIVLHPSAPASTAPPASQPHMGSTVLAPGPAPTATAPTTTPARLPDGAGTLAPTTGATNANGGITSRSTVAGAVVTTAPATPTAPPAPAAVPVVTLTAPMTAPLPPPVALKAPVVPVPVQLPLPGSVPAPTGSLFNPVAAPAASMAFSPGPGAPMGGNTLVPLAQSPVAERVAAAVTAEPGQIVVYWPTPGDADAAMARMLQVYKLTPTSTTKLQHLGGVIAVFQLSNPAAASEMREQLRKEFPNAIVDFNSRYRPLLQPSPQPRIYLPQKVSLPSPGGVAQGANGIRIGIVDGPIARAPVLANVKVQRKSFLADSEVAGNASHATTIATLIAGQDAATGFVGIAPKAVLYSAEIMRTVGFEDATNSAALVLALDWLLSEKVQLINLSLGGPSDLVMEKAFSRLATLSVVVVAAAGNGGPTAPPAYPAAYAGVIAVTATDAADKLYTQANRGSYVTLAAPGVDIWVPDGDGGRYVSGTSFSAAVVTAAGALLMAQSPQHHARTMAQRLCRGAKDLGTPGVDRDFGCGLLQISASLLDDRS